MATHCNSVAADNYLKLITTSLCPGATSVVYKAHELTLGFTHTLRFFLRITKESFCLLGTNRERLLSYC